MGLKEVHSHRLVHLLWDKALNLKEVFQWKLDQINDNLNLIFFKNMKS
jgi:hypothetical protein